MDGNFKKKIQALNDAYVHFNKALTLLDKNVTKTPDMDTHLWRLAKSFKEVNREVMKQLKKENIDDEFLKMMKDF